MTALPQLQNQMVIQEPISEPAAQTKMSSDGSPPAAAPFAASHSEDISEALGAMRGRRHVLVYLSAAALSDPLVLAVMTEAARLEQQARTALAVAASPLASPRNSASAVASHATALRPADAKQWAS